MIRNVNKPFKPDTAVMKFSADCSFLASKSPSTMMYGIFCIIWHSNLNFDTFCLQKFWVLSKRKDIYWIAQPFKNTLFFRIAMITNPTNHDCDKKANKWQLIKFHFLVQCPRILCSCFVHCFVPFSDICWYHCKSHLFQCIQDSNRTILPDYIWITISKAQSVNISQ